MKLCKCGCGKEIIPTYWHKFHPVYYCQGHNKSMLNNHHTQKTRDKIRDSHIGLKASKSTINKLIKSHIGVIPSKESLIKRSKTMKKTIQTKGHKGIFKIGSKGNWKGGVTPYYRLRRSLKYIQWRKNIFKKNDYTCQKCYKKGGYLHAHHIYNFSSNPELRYINNNGITFCKSCHYMFHHIYGIINNNQDQIDEFINAASNHL